MILKQIPQDFIVNEIYDIETFKEKEENRKQPYYYFKLTKTNYGQIDAISKVANIFSTSKKLVHFAGTKDKVGVTSQLISVYGINKDTYEKNLEFFNNLKDLELEYIAQFNGRINLGDNLGNKFVITLRDISNTDIDFINNNFPEFEKSGVFNYFDSQRFGYANNSHIVGKYILQNNIEKAVFEIMTSIPTKNPSDDLIEFVDLVKKNWGDIKEQNIETIDKLIESAPGFLRNEVQMLKQLKSHKNDFPGAFRRIHKKLRTLFVNAYQSYLFNETINQLSDDDLKNVNELELVHSDINLDNNENIKKIVFNLLKIDKITLENFKLKSMPELQMSSIKRVVRIFPKDLIVAKFVDDDLNEDKKKVEISFKLDSGEYATNVIKQLVGDDSL